ncbi:hypothetical protein BV25DRAFT_1920538 [Artomyces pyxidatus]|uniref:Uncharacterized protein n=1 Tax=Artomyces pyxidatus TaxID=48021 RepID=A0ACB8SKE7_9AGAM|nr:hypothetical protein BV25DRAFT_1920538 [Artomyces pyxidatus]
MACVEVPPTILCPSHFDDPDEEGTSYIVMPLLRLRLMDNSDLHFVGEIFDLGKHVFEGLVSLHEQGVPHRSYLSIISNFSEENSMMHATSFTSSVDTDYHDVVRKYSNVRCLKSFIESITSHNHGQ